MRDTAVSAIEPEALIAQLGAYLESGLNQQDLSLSADQRTQLLEYLRLLVRWNAVYNLTSIRDPRDMVPVHLLDSLSILPLLDELGGTLLVDVGTGPGLPGIPLAIARPQANFVLVDAVSKKIGIVRQAIAALKLANIEPIHGRIEALTLSRMPDLIVSRAYSSLSQFAASVSALMGPDTRLVAMKGIAPTEEIAALPPEWRVSDVRPLNVAYLGAERCAVVIERVSR